MKLFVGNFDFEHLLPGRGRHGGSVHLRRLNAELAPTFAIAADAGDVVWTPEPVDDKFAAHLESVGLPRVTFVSDQSAITGEIELCPWGWTERVIRWGREHGWCINAPEMSAVRRVNSRRFSSELEDQFGVALPGACCVASLEDISAAVRRSRENFGDAGWVLKAEFSMSARERILGRGELTEQQLQWAQRRLRDDGVLFFEPWVEKVEEAGLQFTIPQSGAPELEGVTVLLTDAQGQYRGSRFGQEAELQGNWSAAIEFGHRAAVRAQEAGYFGPLGIDAMRYRDSTGEERVRPLQDLNGRWTMGRLSLGLMRLLRAGETGAWLHLRASFDATTTVRRLEEDMQSRLPARVRAVRTSPLLVGGTPLRYQTVALIAPSSLLLNLAIEQITSAGRD